LLKKIECDVLISMLVDENLHRTPYGFKMHQTFWRDYFLLKNSCVGVWIY